MNMRLFLISVAIACAIIVGDAQTKAGAIADEAVLTMELNFSQESATILSQVMAPNGGLTKHLHERF